MWRVENPWLGWMKPIIIMGWKLKPYCIQSSLPLSPRLYHIFSNIQCRRLMQWTVRVPVQCSNTETYSETMDGHSAIRLLNFLCPGPVNAQSLFDNKLPEVVVCSLPQSFQVASSMRIFMPSSLTMSSKFEFVYALLPGLMLTTIFLRRNFPVSFQ